MTDRNGRIVFESGALASNGAITGNDNDADASGVEPHHTEIRTAVQVQIYESVMSDSNGRPTTGLLTAVRYLKDNRLVPRGFDKVTADPQIAVVGSASEDADFAGGGDRIRYVIGISEAGGPFEIDVALRFQVIRLQVGRKSPTVQSEGNPSIRRLLRIDGFLLFGSTRQAPPGRRLRLPTYGFATGFAVEGAAGFAVDGAGGFAVEPGLS